MFAALKVANVEITNFPSTLWKKEEHKIDEMTALSDKAPAAQIVIVCPRFAPSCIYRIVQECWRGVLFDIRFHSGHVRRILAIKKHEQIGVVSDLPNNLFRVLPRSNTMASRTKQTFHDSRPL